MLEDKFVVSLGTMHISPSMLGSNASIVFDTDTL